ncbi:hypothetical protein, partial [Paraburkholderia heleia]|uniref:hypothetical protein n=1 Tax=Paraburkholderia heleia TaxID=634127 RepID=UPI002AB70A8A
PAGAFAPLVDAACGRQGVVRPPAIFYVRQNPYLPSSRSSRFTSPQYIGQFRLAGRKGKWGAQTFAHRAQDIANPAGLPAPLWGGERMTAGLQHHAALPHTCLLLFPLVASRCGLFRFVAGRRPPMT